MTTKDFDCVEMKRQGSERVLAETRGLTEQEELACWQEATEALREARRQGQAPEPAVRTSPYSRVPPVT